MIKSIWILAAAALAAAVASLSFTGVTLAASGADAASEPVGDLVRPVIDAALHGNFLLAAATSLVLVVALVRRYGTGTKWFGWTSTSWGAPLLVLVGSFGAALALTLGAGEAPSWAMVYAASGVAVAAAGGWKILKELGVPLLRKLQSRLPTKLQPLVGLVLWVFESPGAARVEAAEAAGDAAVEAAPATGLDGVLGKPTEVE